MRNVLLTTLSVALFAIITSQPIAAYGQDSTCGLQLRVLEAQATETEESNPITGARAVALKTGAWKSIKAVMVDGQPQFPKLAAGEYKITITKRGFKQTVQPIELICFVPGQDALRYVRLEPGSPARTVVNEKLTVRAGEIVGGDREPVATAAEQAPDEKEVSAGAKPRTVSGGILNDKARSLPQPAYPPIARAARASGMVVVNVTVDEEGKVISAEVASGHPLLRSAALQAAREARFSPTLLDGQPVKVLGKISYLFTLE